MMNYETLLVQEEALQSVRVTLHRPRHRNSINEQLFIDLHAVIDKAEQNPACRFIILQGENNIFCTGMDFQEMTQKNPSASTTDFSAEYMVLLKRFTTTSKIIMVLLDGQVLAGGVGIVAASDFVLSTSR